MKNFIYKSILAVSCIYLYSGYANAACVQNPTWSNMQKQYLMKQLTYNMMILGLIN